MAAKNITTKDVTISVNGTTQGTFTQRANRRTYAIDADANGGISASTVVSTESYDPLTKSLASFSGITELAAVVDEVKRYIHYDVNTAETDETFVVEFRNDGDVEYKNTLDVDQEPFPNLTITDSYTSRSAVDDHISGFWELYYDCTTNSGSQGGSSVPVFDFDAQVEYEYIVPTMDLQGVA